MAAYYSEIDPFAAAWLRELIKAGHIAYGIVDERSIEDVRPQDLRGFTQVHLFAGIGVWSYALRQAGWPDDKPVWTGSCPCQPFSAAGKTAGFDDERHLWPHMHWLIHQCKPPVVFGEQVASKAAEPWFDLVQADVETLGYAFGCVPFPSAGVGAPHIRDRAYWVAYSNDTRPQGWGERGHGAGQRAFGSSGLVDGLGHSRSKPSERFAGKVQGEKRPSQSSWGSNGQYDNGHSNASETSGLAEPNGDRLEEGGQTPKASRHGDSVEPDGGFNNPGPTNGLWRDTDWLFCQDQKWRPVEPGTFPLVDGAAARVGRLRGYGNAINAEAAKAFIEVCCECAWPTPASHSAPDYYLEDLT